MRSNGHSQNHGVETIARWYVASLTPPSHALKQHLGERRSIAEVLQRRRFIEIILATPARTKATALRQPRSQGEVAQEMRARAARYRELAQTLLDPTVASVVEMCAHELEAEIPTLDDFIAAADLPAQERAINNHSSARSPE